VAYLAEKDSRVYVVHNGVRGREYSKIGSVVFSPDGQRIAYSALTDGKWRVVVDGREGRPYDVLLPLKFSPDSQHVVYRAQEGREWYVVVDGRSSPGTISSYIKPEFNADSTLIAYIKSAASTSEQRLIVSDLAFDKQYIKKSIGDLLFVVSKDRTRIATAEVVDKKFRIIDFSITEPDNIHKGPIYDLIDMLTLSDDGRLVSYLALRGRKRVIVLGNREEPFPEGQLRELPVVRPDGKAVGVLLITQGRYSLYQAFMEGKERGKTYDEAESLTYSNDGSYTYAARNGRDWFVVVDGKEGPAFDRVVTPLFGPAGKYLVYRVRKEGRRFVVVADALTGKILRKHPAYEQVFQPVFTSDGKSVAYGVKDGQELWWKVEKL
jgi:Tol biopolymer transport system component